MSSMKSESRQSDWLSVIERVTGDPVLYELLKYCPLDILRSWQLKQFPRGALVFHQGEICDEFHLIIKGEIDVFTTADDGRKYSQARYKKGDMLGELEIFEQRQYICSVEAVSDAALLVLAREDFCRWLALDNYFNQKILQAVSHQYYQLSKKAGEDILYSLHQRICLVLWQKFLQMGSNTPQSIVINKQQLSEQFAVAPRSINRILSELREENIIAINGEQIQVIDPQRLHQHAEH
ncbi:Crp/Fnr family transcriptional regulator [Cedecea davisae]|uniref:Crp/Fnr family transcriptional regulator n=1 Tax=Cedecea davisae TaxID=158484 RepID=UPI00376F2791